jgi:hypothetical protein
VLLESKYGLMIHTNVHISFDKEALNITIRNQYSGLELTSPVYCSKNATCRVSPSQQIVTGSIMEASFGIVTMRKNFKGALLYKLRREHTTETSNQPNSSIEDSGLGG